VRAPTMGEFLQQFGGAYFSTEGALWRTLKLLLLKPGELTRQYLAGRRKHYVLPLRLYLTISVIVLLALRLLASVTMEVRPDNLVIDARESISIEFGAARAGLKEGVFFCENLPGWVCRRLERRLDLDPKSLAREGQQIGERFIATLGPAMFLLLPAFALWTWLVYWNRRLRYTEHLVFALHLHAFWFLILGLTLLPLRGLENLAWLVVPVYTLLAMRRVFRGRWWLLVLRSGLITTLYGIVLIVAMVGAALWAVLA
jgi:Protein of unknown function (DUF3667)